MKVYIVTSHFYYERSANPATHVQKVFKSRASAVEYMRNNPRSIRSWCELIERELE